MELNLRRVLLLVGAAFAVIMLFTTCSRLFEMNNAGHIQVRQAWPSGDLSVRFTPGMYWQGFGDISTYPLASTLNFTAGHQGQGKNNPGWKGGRKKSSSGYVLVYSPQHPHADSKHCVAEHRLVMEKKIGRYLLPEETVHHINGIHDDNREENLELWASIHPAGQRPEELVGWAKKILKMYGE